MAEPGLVAPSRPGAEVVGRAASNRPPARRGGPNGARPGRRLYAGLAGRILCVVGTGAAGRLVWSLDFKSNGGPLRVRGGFDSHLPPPVNARYAGSRVGRSRRRAEGVAPVLPHRACGVASGPDHGAHREDRGGVLEQHPRQLPSQQGVRPGTASGRGRDPVRGTCGSECAGAHHRQLSRPRHVEDPPGERDLRCVEAAGAHLSQPEGTLVPRGGVGSLSGPGYGPIPGLPGRGEPVPDRRGPGVHPLRPADRRAPALLCARRGSSGGHGGGRSLEAADVHGDTAAQELGGGRKLRGGGEAGW